MNRSIRALVFTAALLLLPPTAICQDNDREAVDQVMQKMMRAFETGDRDLVFEVFRRDGVVVGYVPSRAALAQESAEKWAEGFTGSPAHDEEQRHRSYEILEVTDSAAMVKVLLDYPQWKGLDYLALSKIDGKWMIISKSWSARTTAGPRRL